MKKTMVGILVLASFLFSLSGCGGDEKTVANNSESLLSSSEETMPAEENESMKVSPTDGDISQVDSGNQAGFYTVEDVNGHSIATYIDYGTRTQTPLCNRPECTHSDSSCTAYALIDGVSMPVFAVIGDRLFVVQTEAGADTLPRIIVAGLDGSSPETLVELDASVSIAPQLYTDGSHIYALATVFSGASSHLELYQFDLQKGSFESLCRFPEGADGQIASGFDHTLTFSLFVNDEETGDMTDVGQVYHTDTNVLDEPVASQIAGSQESFVIYNHTLVSVDTRDAATCTMTFQDLVSGEKITYQTADLLAESGMDSARINVYDLWDDWYRITLTQDDAFASYNVNPVTGEHYPMTLYYEGSSNVVLVLSETSDKLLVRAKWDETREGDTLVNLAPVYGLISKEDYLHSVPNFEYITGLAG